MFRGALADGLVLGTLVGFAETVLAYATGTAPRADSAVVFGVGFAVVALAGAGLHGLNTCLRHSAVAGLLARLALRLDVVSAVLLLVGVGVLFSVRGPAHLVRWAIPVAAALAWLASGRPDATRQPRRFTTLAAATVFPSVLLVDWSTRPNGTWPGVLLPLLVGGALLMILAGGMALRTVILGTALSFAVAWGLGVPSGPSPPAALLPPGARVAGPNLVLVVLDGVRADRLGRAGVSLAPQLDRLALRATAYSHASATSPYSLSSHASLFMGLLPSEHGAHSVPWDEARPEDVAARAADHSLAEGIPTLAERFRARGYRTGAIVANRYYLGLWTGLGRGFSAYAAQPPRFYGYWPLVVPLARRLAGPDAWPPWRSWSSAEVAGAAIEWLELAPRQPFFLFLNMMDAHFPYGVDVAADREQSLAAYDRRIAEMDAAVGRLLDWVEARGLTDTTAVVVTADHGESFGEHGLRQHMRDLYDEVLHVPLLARWPGQRRAARVEGRVGLHDVGRALAALAGGDRAERVLAEAARFDGPRVMAEFWVSAFVHGGDPRRSSTTAMRTIEDGRFKLIERRGGPSALFDLAEDPTEARDLLAADPEAACAVVERLLAGLPPLGDRRPPRPAARPPDPEGLAALGY